MECGRYIPRCDSTPADIRKVRSEFDHMLLNHSRSMGVSVYERTKVNSISFSSDDPDTPISVSWTHTLPPCPISPPASPIEASFSPFLTGKSTSNITPDTVSISGETTFTHLIDATGRAGIMSSRYLKNRHLMPRSRMWLSGDTGVIPDGMGQVLPDTAPRGSKR